MSKAIESPFLKFLEAGEAKGGFETDDVLAALLPLMKQVPSSKVSQTFTNGSLNWTRLFTRSWQSLSSLTFPDSRKFYRNCAGKRARWPSWRQFWVNSLSCPNPSAMRCAAPICRSMNLNPPSATKA